MQVHNRYRQAGGEDSVLETERRLLEAAGHEVARHVEQNPDDLLGSIVGLAASPWNLRAARRVVAEARRIRPDVAHIHNTWFRLSPAVVRGLHDSGVPTVVTMHNYRLACLNAQLYREAAPCEDCVGRIPWRGVVRACYRDSPVQSAAVAATVMLHRSLDTWGAAADVVVALSEFSAERLVASGVPADSIVIKENVVEDPGPRPGPPSDSSHVLFAGRLAEEKGILDLIDAWRSNPLPDLGLRIAGSGPLMGQIAASAPDGVELLGQVDGGHMRELLLSARALVFPSRWYEGQAMILLEALSAGLPIVFPQIGAIPETVGTAGWAYGGPGSGSLPEALEGLTDDAAVDEKGEEARACFDARFAPGPGTQRLVDVYERARRVHGR